jgi:hypothetical protein
MPEEMKQFVGSWKKLTNSTCSLVYPKLIEFKADGLYSGTGMEPGNVPGWDVGTWKIVSRNQVKISTINDAIITYEFSIYGDILTFEDPNKCKFQYQKVRQ